MSLPHVYQIAQRNRISIQLLQKKKKTGSCSMTGHTVSRIHNSHKVSWELRIKFFLHFTVQFVSFESQKTNHAFTQRLETWAINLTEYSLERIFSSCLYSVAYINLHSSVHILLFEGQDVCTV